MKKPNRGKIWRYISLSQYIQILSTKSFNLTPVAVYQQTDPFEGAIPKLEIAHYEKLRKEFDLQGSAITEDQNDTLSPNLLVSCWHRNPHESWAMWKLYCGVNEGIAIQTTVKKLNNLTNSGPNNHFMAEMSYIDYEKSRFYRSKDMYSGMDEALPFYHKHIGFKHEREVRVSVITANPKDSKLIKMWFNDFDNIIERVFVHPNSNESYKQIVKEVTYKWGSNKEVRRSKLLKNQIYLNARS